MIGLRVYREDKGADRAPTSGEDYASEGIQTMIWAEAEVATPHWSVAVAVMMGWLASEPRVEIQATIEVPVPNDPQPGADQRTSTVSPLGSDALADRVT
ncbi:MAG TPA: hypothetical protein VLB67_07225 [Acidimicrobiia bacterium]|nr:hypothetical protein [Acidimicrobiia bacterium]